MDPKSAFTAKEVRVLRKLTTPHKVQDFLNTLPFNFEKKGDTLMSPSKVLRERKAHCFEGALLAAAALWLQGREPLLLDLTPTKEDDGHVVALFTENGYWGAISKTNHAVLRYRDPIYKTVRELALSYFHEYFLNGNGKKTLRSFAGPYNLKSLKQNWLSAQDDLFFLHKILNNLPRQAFIPKGAEKRIRPADAVEREAGRIVEWK